MSEYEADILQWSVHQAALLRRRAAGEPVNEAELDWEHLAEEIEGVGRSQLSAVRSHIVLALVHDLKAEAWPLACDVPHWRAEARGHRLDAQEAFSPSMEQRIDMPKLYRDALHRMPETLANALRGMPAARLCSLPRRTACAPSCRSGPAG